MKIIIQREMFYCLNKRKILFGYKIVSINSQKYLFLFKILSNCSKLYLVNSHSNIINFKPKSSVPVESKRQPEGIYMVLMKILLKEKVCLCFVWLVQIYFNLSDHKRTKIKIKDKIDKMTCLKIKNSF